MQPCSSYLPHTQLRSQCNLFHHTSPKPNTAVHPILLFTPPPHHTFQYMQPFSLHLPHTQHFSPCNPSYISPHTRHFDSCNPALHTFPTLNIAVHATFFITPPLTPTLQSMQSFFSLLLHTIHFNTCNPSLYTSPTLNTAVHATLFITPPLSPTLRSMQSFLHTSPK